jgi:hypothetical protein
MGRGAYCSWRIAVSSSFVEILRENGATSDSATSGCGRLAVVVLFHDHHAVTSGLKNLERRNPRKLLVSHLKTGGDATRGRSVVLIRRIVKHKLRRVTPDHL